LLLSFLLVLLFFKICQSVFVQYIVSLTNACGAHASYSIITSIWNLQFLMSIPNDENFSRSVLWQEYFREYLPATLASLFQEETRA